MRRLLTKRGGGRKVQENTLAIHSAVLGYEKPHPRAYTTVLQAMGPDLSTVWMIGDSFTADVLGAEAAGIPAVLVRRSHPDAQRFSETLEEVPAMLGF